MEKKRARKNKSITRSQRLKSRKRKVQIQTLIIISLVIIIGGFFF